MTIATGLYQHYKGQQYRVLGVAQHCQRQRSLWWYYQALYGEFGLWLRPLSMFTEQVLVEGVLQPRFALLQREESLFARS